MGLGAPRRSGARAESPPWPGPLLESVAAAPAVCWGPLRPGEPGLRATPGIAHAAPRCAACTGAGPAAAPAPPRSRGGRGAGLRLLRPLPSPLSQPAALGLTVRFCSFVHCSLNSFRHFSTSVRLAARGCEGWGVRNNARVAGSYHPPGPRGFHALHPFLHLHSLLGLLSQICPLPPRWPLCRVSVVTSILWVWSWGCQGSPPEYTGHLAPWPADKQKHSFAIAQEACFESLPGNLGQVPQHPWSLLPHQQMVLMVMMPPRMLVEK